MQIKTKNTESVQQSGSQEIKDLITLVTLPNDGDAVHIHAEVQGRAVFDIYPGLTCYVLEALAYRVDGNVNLYTQSQVLEADTTGFATVTITTDGDDVKLTMNFNHPTLQGDTDLLVEWTLRPIPS